ncbi:MAG: YdeI/OmpD-associated family protein [Anaerolineales bacterium]|nr:YdeI/OmpD-associated family protein [Anaerolineales bacterium]
MEEGQEGLFFVTQQEWHEWLEANHATAREAWLLISKKGAERKSLTLAEAVEEALCYGWIDSHMRPIDTQAYRLRFSPRKPGGIWALSNVHRVERLTQEGRMTPAGLAAVESAKANGEWEAAARREDIRQVPPELDEVLQADAEAMAVYQKMAPSLIKQYHHWINSAKRAETRAKRIAALVEKLRVGSIK